MTVVLYENGTHETGKKLWTLIEGLVTKDQSELFNTMDDFTNKLRQPMNGISIAILMITTGQELKELISLRELMDNIRLILVLSDRNTKTLALGRHLKTSYISDIDSNLSNVASVLGQILIKEGTSKVIK